MTLADDARRLTALGHHVYPVRVTEDANGDKITDFLGIRWQDSEPPDPDTYPARANNLYARLQPGTAVLDIDDMDKFKATGLQLPEDATWAPSRKGVHVFFRTDSDRVVPQIVDPGETGYDTRVGGKGIVFVWHPEAWTAPGAWVHAPDFLYHRPKVGLQELIDGAEPGGITFPLSTDGEIMRWLGSIYTAAMTPADAIALQQQAYLDGRIIATGRPWTLADFERHTRAMRNWEPVRSDAPPTPEGMPSSDGTIRNIVDYLRDVPLVVPWLIEGIAFQNGITLISGEPKAGKSTFAAQIMAAREVEFGRGKFLGPDVAPGPTLLVTEESGVPVRYKVGHLTDLDVYDLSAAAGEKFTATLQKVMDWAVGRCDEATGLVFIDTLSVWAQIDDENDATKVTNALKLIKRVAQIANLSIILVHHQRKSGGSNGNAIRGSGALLANVDHSLELKRTSEESSDRKLNTQGRVSDPEFLLLGYDKATKTYELIDAPTGGSDDIEEQLAAIPPDGPGITWAATGLTREKLNHLVNIGRARVSGKLGRAYLYQSIPPAE
jgi:hypothetical protein